jgi:hypothetical protein
MVGNTIFITTEDQICVETEGNCPQKLKEPAHTNLQFLM